MFDDDLLTAALVNGVTRKLNKDTLYSVSKTILQFTISVDYEDFTWCPVYTVIAVQINRLSIFKLKGSIQTVGK